MADNGSVRRLAFFAVFVGPIAVVLGLSKIHAVQHGYAFHTTSRLAWSIPFMALLALSAYTFGVPDAPRRQSAIYAAVGASVAAAIAMSVIQLFAGDALLPRFVVFGAAVLLVPWNVATVWLASHARGRELDRERVFLVGAESEEAGLREDLGRDAARPARLVDARSVRSLRPSDEDPQPLITTAEDCRATLLVLAREAQEDSTIVAQAAMLHERGLRIRTLTAFSEEWLGKLPISELERVSLMIDIGEIHRQGYTRIKRIIDVALGFSGALCLFVLLPVIGIGDLLANRGRILYRQPRVGINGRVFDIWKLRTMRPARDDRDREWTSEVDLRITPFGRLLRHSHLDELPQVVNVLRGDLSIVGPRPEQPQYVVELEEKIPFYGMRHLVRPGITGWAQIRYQYAGNELEAMEKLQYEFWYIRHQSFALDARIIGRTLRDVIALRGR
jgi:lipopolysaccharide/colanic/teichoic acid biosynthesis glycosyltransferase